MKEDPWLALLKLAIRKGNIFICISLASKWLDASYRND
jgi:hypothetical protein